MIHQFKRRVGDRVERYWKVLIFLFIFIGLWPIYGKIIGTVFPVVSTARIISLTPYDSGHPQTDVGWFTVTYETYKYFNCTYKSMALWWRDEDGASIRIPRKDLPESPTTDQSRPIGLNRITLLVQTSLPTSQWHMQVNHDCHPFLPIIKTVLLP